MTNGEKFKQTFPNSFKVRTFFMQNGTEHIVIDGVDGETHDFVLDWWDSEYEEPTAKNDLGVDCIDRAELLKAMDTWDKFGYTETGCFVRAPKNDCVPYVHYNDMVNCVKGMPSVTPQEPKTGYLSIDDVMSVFDDFMCGEVDEDGTETFWEMLKDKAETEAE